MLSNARFAEFQGKLIGIDKESIAYFCSSNNGLRGRCHAIRLGNDKSIWDLNLGNGAEVVGGALAPGRLYIALRSGYLLALAGR